MTLRVIEQEVKKLSEEEQDNLAAYLAVLRLHRSPEHAAELSRRLDDKAPEHWLTLDALKSELENP